MILVVDMNWKRDSLAFNEFVQSIVTIVEPLEECTVKHYMELEPADIDKASKIILSGNTLKDHETHKHLDRFSWIKTFDRPILGVCAGMQTISLVFENPLKPCLQVGMTEIQTVKDNPLFEGNFSVYTLHNYSVSASETFEVLAQSGNCIQAFKHKEKSVYGVLFHPEVRNQEILKRFLELKK
ncbi:MAG: glutamine amidotransferase-related protein [Candidatus Bathyarchaeia archaeon]|jgi:GMP synthase (glutamine-hydrolysing)